MLQASRNIKRASPLARIRAAPNVAKSSPIPAVAPYSVARNLCAPMVQSARISEVSGIQRNAASLSSVARVNSLMNNFKPADKLARSALSSSNLSTATQGGSKISSDTKYPLVQHESFDVLQHEDVREHNITVTTYKHKLSGAEIMSVQSEEEEKVFGIVFPTPVDDDTGVAHILEHSVLCGSKKYPLKEPFVQLLKSSLKTYLNAMTYPDRTVYPVASPNTQDFYNLVNVYCDAVFNPMLEPWVLKQEGWHYEVVPAETDATQRELEYKGVVFNEMKGVYSSADAIRAGDLEAALFPDSNYSKSSGGDPLAIPTLTFDKFTAFHRKYYHPSNAKVFWYGDDPVATRLAMTDEYLSAATKDRPAPEVVTLYPDIGPNTVRLQPLFNTPRRVSKPYPCSGMDEAAGEEGELVDEAGGEVEEAFEVLSRPGETPKELLKKLSGKFDGKFNNTTVTAGVPDKHDVVVSWVLNGHPADLTEAERVGLGVLNHLLIQTQVATLYKTLADSALGAAVIGDGYDGKCDIGATPRARPHVMVNVQKADERSSGAFCADSVIQATFSAGLKGVKGRDIEKVEALVVRTLEKIAADGFTAEHIESSMNTIEFGLREFANGGNPRGLSLFLGCIPGWIYGRNPVDELKFEKALVDLRAAIASNPQYFQDLIRKYLVTNPHRVTMHMYPDPTFGENRDATEAQALERAAAGLSEGDWLAIQAEQEALLKRQATPDPPEAVATIPTLKVEDLPKHSKLIARVEKQLAPDAATRSHAPVGRLLAHEQPTNGIGYGSISFDLSSLPQHLLPYMPLFTWCLTSCGTKRKTEVEMAHLLGTHTGGVWARSSVVEVPGRVDAALPLLTVSSKALKTKTDRMSDLMLELIAEANLDRRDRIEHYLRSAVSRHESSLVSSGNKYASSLLGAQFNKTGWISDVWGGLTQFYAVRSLSEQLQSGGPDAFETLVAALEEIRQSILVKSHAFATVTGDSGALPPTEQALRRVVDELGAAPQSDTPRLGSGWHWPSHPNSHREKSPHKLSQWPFASLFPQELGNAGLVPQYIGIVVPSQVNYVVKAAPGLQLSTSNRFTPGSFEVISGMLNTGYLWDRVRVQGGAYGGFCGIGRFSGVMAYGSYRDPNLGETLEVYDGTTSWLKKLAGSAHVKDDINKAIIATVGGIDAPMSPAEKGDTSALRYLTGITDQDVQKRRDEILGTSVQDINAFAAVTDRVQREGRVVVVASEAAFAEYHAKYKDKPTFELTKPLKQKS